MYLMAKQSDPSREDRLSASQVRHIAKFARLSISDADAQEYALQLAKVINHFQSLQRIDLEGIEPLTHPIGQLLHLQDDKTGPTLPLQSLLDLAPESVPPFIKVPKVLPGETSS